LDRFAPPPLRRVQAFPCSRITGVFPSFAFSSGRRIGASPQFAPKKFLFVPRRLQRCFVNGLCSYMKVFYAQLIPKNQVVRTIVFLSTRPTVYSSSVFSNQEFGTPPLPAETFRDNFTGDGLCHNRPSTELSAN